MDKIFQKNFKFSCEIALYVKRSSLFSRSLFLVLAKLVFFFWGGGGWGGGGGGGETGCWVIIP